MSGSSSQCDEDRVNLVFVIVMSLCSPSFVVFVCYFVVTLYSLPTFDHWDLNHFFVFAECVIVCVTAFGVNCVFIRDYKGGLISSFWNIIYENMRCVLFLKISFLWIGMHLSIPFIIDRERKHFNHQFCDDFISTFFCSTSLYLSCCCLSVCVVVTCHFNRLCVRALRLSGEYGLLVI